MLTLERLKQLLYYDPDTGIFWWVAPLGRVAVGTVAGTVTSRGYTRIRIGGRSYGAHRLAWQFVTGAWPEQEIDHINRDRMDNRWDNLRVATTSQNHANNTRKVGKYGFKGVSTATRSRWLAKIRVYGRLHHLGSFDTKEEAHAAYCRAAKEHFGEFARFA